MMYRTDVRLSLRAGALCATAPFPLGSLVLKLLPWGSRSLSPADRLHLYDEAPARGCKLAFWDPQWESCLARCDIHHLLLSKDDPETVRIIGEARNSVDWHLLLEEDIYVLFERQSLTEWHV